MKCSKEVLKQAESSMPVFFPFCTECMKYCRNWSLCKHVSVLSYIIQDFQFPDGVDYLTPYAEVRSTNPAPVLYRCSTLQHCIIDTALPLATTYVLPISSIQILSKCLQRPSCQDLDMLYML